MSNETDGQMVMEIWLSRPDHHTITLGGETLVRFEEAYRKWLTSGRTAGEFEYTADGIIIFLRLDQIVMREKRLMRPFKFQEPLKQVSPVKQREIERSHGI